MKRLGLVCAALFSAAFGDPRTVTGRVRARGSGRPVTASILELPAKEHGVEADPSGGFSLEVAGPSGSLLVKAPGYEDKQVDYSRETVPLEIFLNPSLEAEEGGVIRARRKAEVSSVTVQREELALVPGAGGDAIKGLTTLPSVQSYGFGGQLVIQGGAPGDNAYFLDAMNIPFVLHFADLGATIPTRLLESVDLYAGGFSVLYPNATGGIIQLRTAQSIPERFGGEFELGLLQSSLYLEGNWGGQDDPGKRVGYRMGLRRTYIDLILGGVIQKFSKGVSFATLPSATDYSFVLNGSHGDGTWQAYLLGAADGLALAAPSQYTTTADGKSSFKFKNYYETLGFDYVRPLGQGWSLRLSPQQIYSHFSQVFFDNEVNARAFVYALGARAEQQLTPRVSFTLGVRPEFTTYVTSIDVVQFSPSSLADPFFDITTAPRVQSDRSRSFLAGSAFGDLTWKVTESIAVNPGLLFQQGSHAATQQALDPRVSARWTLSPKWTLKGATGLYSQRPTPAQDDPVYGNSRLALERYHHVVLGAESRLADGWSGDLQVYSKESSNLVATAVVNPALTYENSGAARSKGLELLVKKDLTGRTFGWLSYTLSKAEVREPHTRVWETSPYDITQSLKLVASYKFTPRLTVGGTTQWSRGSPYTEILGGTCSQTVGSYKPYTPPGANAYLANNGRLPAFFQQDLRVDYDFHFDTWKLTAYADIRNVTNRANAAGVGWSPDYSERELIAGIPVVPFLGVKASF